MGAQEINNTLSELKKQLDNLLPLKQEDEERLWKKFRLEWNYNSNHIEGNTLTYGETQLLLIFGKTSGDHNKREYDEMQAHDVAIKMVRELAADNERPLTEAFIRKLNEIILVTPYWKEAITLDNQQTRREIKIGEYKSFPNSVRLQNGEIFHYAKPEETPALMNDLMKWYESNKNIEPVELAAQFHYRFVRIHPFDDGNGRIARLIMNYILLKADYPPVIIKSKDKNGYLTALNKADVGDADAFTKYISEQLVWSLNINIKAAKGEDIEEDDDLDKEIALLAKNSLNKEQLRTSKNINTINNIWSTSILPLYLSFVEKTQKFDALFLEQRHAILIDGHETNIREANQVEALFKQRLADYKNLNEINIYNEWKGYKNNGVNTFNYWASIKIYFQEFKISIDYVDRTFRGMTKEVLYDSVLSKAEIDSITSEIAYQVLNKIHSEVNKEK